MIRTEELPTARQHSGYHLLIMQYDSKTCRFCSLDSSSLYERVIGMCLLQGRDAHCPPATLWMIYTHLLDIMDQKHYLVDLSLTDSIRSDLETTVPPQVLTSCVTTSVLFAAFLERNTVEPSSSMNESFEVSQRLPFASETGREPLVEKKQASRIPHKKRNRNRIVVHLLVTAAGLLVLFGVYILLRVYVFENSVVDVSILEAEKCPACAGQSICHAFFRGEVHFSVLHRSRLAHKPFNSASYGIPGSMGRSSTHLSVDVLPFHQNRYRCSVNSQLFCGVMLVLRLFCLQVLISHIMSSYSCKFIEKAK
ncbi:hypothetical protein PHET_08960 [Paragonimus heterotremus]|uniref:Uncharacterized protein n=1 Tax=Paragonimus heterotremus TaxID=100268 RepID=A0A8J4TBA1_9TREM|nr:hypothetical protein PHET_08960 [Paragonimus heterotremus]